MPLSDHDALLPAGFWAAVTVWLERPQVANKRLCGARMEARGRTLWPRTQAECGPRQGQGHGLEREPGHSPKGEPELGPRAGREGTAPAADLDSLWDRVSQSLVHANPEMLAFLCPPSLGSQPEAAQELDLILRTVIPKASPHSPLREPKKELVVRGRKERKQTEKLPLFETGLYMAWNSLCRVGWPRTHRDTPTSVPFKCWDSRNATPPTAQHWPRIF